MLSQIYQHLFEKWYASFSKLVKKFENSITIWKVERFLSYLSR